MTDLLWTGSLVTDFWNHQLVEHDRQGVFLVLVAFLGSFGFIRMSTRMIRSPRFQWWPGSVVSEGGVHVHHLVFGICAMIAAGTFGFATNGESPWFEISAAVFGIGAGLTVDEFALWVYLDDVYWSEQGRGSVDAVVIASAAMFLVLLGVRPFELDEGSSVDLALSIVATALGFAAVAVSFMKQRLLHGVVGFFVAPVAFYGALRIGKPRSPFARRFYGDRNPGKQAKAVDRFAPERRTERVKERFRDLVGGMTGEAYEARLARKERSQAASE